MEPVQNEIRVHTMEVSSSSSSEHSPIVNDDNISKFNDYYQRYNSGSNGDQQRRQGSTCLRNNHRSMTDIHETQFQATPYHHKSNVDITVRRESQHSINSLQNSIKRFNSLQIPIVGYEVMEERARFTIFKLKVEDDKRDQSWLVFRRYTDFVRLYSRIKNEVPNLNLPLPGKRWFRDNFEPAFLEERVKGLQKFVNDVLKKIPNHELVREFFCLDEPPQVISYQPEVQALYGALEDSIASLKLQVKQMDSTIMHLQSKLAQLEMKMKGCSNCSGFVN